MRVRVSSKQKQLENLVTCDFEAHMVERDHGFIVSYELAAQSAEIRFRFDVRAEDPEALNPKA